jgi:RNA polymerase sigma-70 factor (ECF subfamily)
MLGDLADSEDIAQEAFVKGMTSIGTLRDSGQFPAWISQIARNLCKDLLRKKSRHRELLDRRTGETSSNQADFSDLHSALARLPEKYRLPLMLFYFDGKSTEKLAGELDLSQAGACTRLSRARKELRRLLSKKAGGK